MNIALRKITFGILTLSYLFIAAFSPSATLTKYPKKVGVTVKIVNADHTKSSLLHLLSKLRKHVVRKTQTQTTFCATLLSNSVNQIDAKNPVYNYNVPLLSSRVVQSTHKPRDPPRLNVV